MSNRHQRVSVNGSLSHWLAALSGIPQGSVLGLALFIVYINDLVRNRAMLFTDDTNIYAPIRNEENHRGLQE